MATKLQEHPALQILFNINDGPFSLDYIEEMNGFTSLELNTFQLPSKYYVPYRYRVNRRLTYDSHETTFATYFYEKKYLYFNIFNKRSVDYYEKSIKVYNEYLFRDFINDIDDNRKYIYRELIDIIKCLNIPLRLIVDVVDYIKTNLMDIVEEEGLLVPELVIRLWKNYHQYFGTNPAEIERRYKFDYSQMGAEREFQRMERSLENYRSNL